MFGSQAASASARRLATSVGVRRAVDNGGGAGEVVAEYAVTEVGPSRCGKRAVRCLEGRG